MSGGSSLLTDAASWLGNVSSSVCIVFVNRILMTTYGFRFACSLSALHYVACTAAMLITARMSGAKDAIMPFKDLAIFTIVADASIITLNLSLLFNPVGVYQVAKLLVIPFVCFVEVVFLRRSITLGVVAPMAVVVMGVAVVVVEDLRLDITLVGLVMAGLSVISSGMQQVLVHTMQHRLGLTANELLGKTAPAQAWSLLAAGPLLDRVMAGQWVTRFAMMPAAAGWLLGSCCLAVLVNVSQFACLGRFRAVTFQVMGHSKTVLVLLGSWLFLGEKMSQRKLAGMALAVGGMVWYGHASTMAARRAAAATALDAGGGDEEARGLLKAGGMRGASDKGDSPKDKSSVLVSILEERPSAGKTKGEE